MPLGTSDPGRKKNTAKKSLAGYRLEKKSISKYEEKKIKDKAVLIFKNLMAEMPLKQLLSGEYRLSEDFMKKIDYKHLPDTCMDEKFASKELEIFFLNEKAFKIFERKIEKQNAENRYSCKICNRYIVDGQILVGCDSCLLWFHIKCVQYKKTKKNESNPWFCTLCQESDN